MTPYPWSEWCDGREVRAVRGTDWEATVVGTFTRQLRSIAKRLGRAVEYRVEDGGAAVVFRFEPPAEGQPAYADAVRLPRAQRARKTMAPEQLEVGSPAASRERAAAAIERARAESDLPALACGDWVRIAEDADVRPEWRGLAGRVRSAHPNPRHPRLVVWVESMGWETSVRWEDLTRLDEEPHGEPYRRPAGRSGKRKPRPAGHELGRVEAPEALGPGS